MAKKNNNIHEITIKIEGEEWQKALDESFKKKVKNVTIDGFRKGKCPRNIYDKKVGIETLFDEAGNIVLQDAYTKAIEEAKVIPVIPGEVELTSIDKDQATFKFTITSRPLVTIKNYKGLGVKEEKATVTDEEVDEEVKKLLDKYAELVIKEDGSVEADDLVTIDYEGFLGSKAFEGGKGENYPLQIGSGTFIPGFEEQLIGMKKEEEKEIKVTFPEEYHEESLKGKEATFKVKVNEVKETIIPSLNEEFFKDLNMEGVNDRASLESALKETLAARKEQQAEGEYVDKLLEKLSEQTKIELPEEMIGDEIHRMIHQYEDNLKMQGITLEQFYQFTNSNEDMLKEQMKDEAVKRIKYRLMLEEIIKLEKLTATDEEADKEASEIASKYGMEKEDFLTQFGGLEMIKYDLEMRKAIDVLKGNK